MELRFSRSFPTRATEGWKSALGPGSRRAVAPPLPNLRLPQLLAAVRKRVQEPARPEKCREGRVSAGTPVQAARQLRADRRAPVDMRARTGMRVPHEASMRWPG